MSLTELMEHVVDLYRWRNAMHQRGEELVFLCIDGVATLQIFIRKQQSDKELLAKALASMFARLTTLANSFVELPILRALSKKLPIRGSPYCGNKPCSCPLSNRPPLSDPKPGDCEDRLEQSFWSFTRWCAHSEDVYGAVNRERGVNVAIGRLDQEVKEIIKEIRESRYSKEPLDIQRERLAEEFADAFGWVFALANLFGVADILETTIKERYEKCWRCGEKPCNCGAVGMFVKRANPITGPDSALGISPESANTITSE